MNARSLVGMTQGARKRAARAKALMDCTCRRCLKGIRNQRLWPPEKYTAARPGYRIGERLRPCPWQDHATCAALESTPGLPACDGSGVLPARVRSSHIRALRPGDRVRMPCALDRWETVTEVQDTSIPGFDCFVIRCGDFGHGGERPLEIRRAKAR